MLVLIFIRIYLNVKKIIYFYLLSDNKPDFYLKDMLQPAQFIGKGRISIGQNSTIGVWPSPQLLSGYAYLEARGKDSKIMIGEGTSINNSASIIADKTTIFIGNNCLIGQCVNIFDSDFHGLELENRNNGVYECSPVSIGDNVFIGANVTILKGVNVGEGSVIASGSVVVKNVEPFSIVAGIPAKKIRSL
ncbi:acetyltransferase [Pseudomonas dryadis]|uniref:Acetyltransferase n=2 Tax=Pseudomonadales TaxID=72274 RepID=A0ABY1ZCN1_9GAMM|nr:acetyltransferase [Pseudomonas dryadis]TBV19858.1 acetyltransferase [Pseudomonas sp. FRB 230]